MSHSYVSICKLYIEVKFMVICWFIYITEIELFFPVFIKTVKQSNGKKEGNFSLFRLNSKCAKYLLQLFVPTDTKVWYFLSMRRQKTNQNIKKCEKWRAERNRTEKKVFVKKGGKYSPESKVNMMKL